MTLTAKGWKNKKGTSDRTCGCGSWKQHWLNASGKNWRTTCSILGFSNTATLGAHITNMNNAFVIGVCSEIIDTTLR